MDRFRDKGRRVIHNRVVHVRRKAALQLFHPRADGLGGVECVGSRLLEDGQADRGLAVETAGSVFVLGAQLNAAKSASCFILTSIGNEVFQPCEPPVGAGFHHDVAELLGIGQSSQRAQRVLERLSLRHRRAAE